jgi:hypothetical protein
MDLIKEINKFKANNTREDSWLKADFGKRVQIKMVDNKSKNK